MHHQRLFSCLPIAAALLLASSFTITPRVAAAASPPPIAIDETKMALRDLWVEHIFWIRSYVVATQAEDSARAKVAEQQVVANAKALAATITPFYGQAASDGLLQLLAGHWGAVQDYSKATHAKSKTAKDKATGELTANARQIAKFLNGANPHLPEDVVFGLLSAHGGHHVAQINQLAARDFAAEAQTWQAMRHHMLMISDGILDGIVKQFPERFREKKP